MSAGAKPAYLQRLVGDVRVLVLGSWMLTEEDFDAHVAEAVAMAASTSVVLLAIYGSPPMSADRRMKLAKAGLTKQPAVLTDSVATAIAISS